MNNKWNKYENEQKLILSQLNEEINKKRVSKINIFYNNSYYLILIYFVQ